MDKLISVIIPAYNAEKFLEKCLSSLAAQSYKSFEALIVVDGATDKTLELARSFSRQDSRFKAFYKENGGPSAAKNYGLDRAAGDYVTFVDSDDYVDENYLEALAEPMQPGSLSVTGCVDEFEDGQSFKETRLIDGYYNAAQLMDYMFISQMEIGGYDVNKLYDLKLIKEIGLRFIEGKKYMFEDILFNYTYMKQIEGGYCRGANTYHYVHYQNEGMSRGLDCLDDKWLHYVDVLDMILEENDQRYPDFLKKVAIAKVWHCGTALRVLAHFDKKGEPAYKAMKKYVGKHLGGFLCCKNIPLKRRIGGAIGYFFPKTSFKIWDKLRY